MCNNVIILFLLLFFTKSGEHFRLFSSDAGTYKEARPFFTSTKNLINDYFDGNMPFVTQTIHSHTYVFVMYYANFCGISRRMREPYEKAAAFYRERIPSGNSTIDKFHVKFVAIDCFFHDGLCRKSYKLNYYPQMFLYVKGTRGYQYFGPTITSNLIEFVEKIRMPIIRLTNVDEFLDFIVQHESNILAQFDFSNDLHRQYYSLFVQVAFKHIEYDNEHPTRFAVILNQSIIEEISKFHNITLQKPFIISHRLDSVPINIFPNITNNFTVDNLFSWVVNEYKKPYAGWIVPKNRYYSRSPSIDKATVVDALTDHDNLLIFLTSNKPDELKLRQMYLYLAGCNTTHSSLWLKQIEKLNNQSLINAKENLTNSERHLLSSCCKYALNQISTSDIYNLCVKTDRFPSLNLLEPKAKRCLPILQNSSLLKICYRNYCQRWLRNSTSIYQEKFTNNHEIILQKRREKFYDQSTKIDDLIHPNQNSIEKYKGFLCRINSTWAFRLIDSRYYPSFGQNIGLVNNSKAIIVLQSKNEQHYILNDNEITIENIYNLIDEVSHNLRSRTLTTILNDNIIIRHSNRLLELTTNTFHSIVLNSDKHVLVVYYTKWCGFCQSIWPVLFQTKKFFNQFTDLIFARIQADKHDLPWHLTVFNYPSIILFPAERKNHSTVFPTSAESITSINLIKFLLYHLYMTNNVDEQQWCKQTNNSFFSMLASTYVDFSQLSYLVQSRS